MNATDIILNGNNQQKARQILDLLKDKQLSPEQLDMLIPHTKDFLKELTDEIKRQTEIDKSNYDKIIDASFQLINNLLLSMKEAPTESERLTFLSVIEKIHARTVEIQINEKNNNHKSKSILAILGTILLGIIFILSAGFIGSKSNEKS